MASVAFAFLSCSNEDIRNIPILMLSSVPIPPDKRFAHAGEVDMVTPDAYLVKPVDHELFLKTIRNLIR